MNVSMDKKREKILEEILKEDLDKVNFKNN
jgi:hypothetical protein